jgi:poly(A) polymerase
VTVRVTAPWLGSGPVRKVVGALAADGRPARFVGGCVRDALVDPTADAADIDIATPERPERALALLAVRGLRALPTGLRHGTVSLCLAGRRFEITTLRRDVACDGRHAAVEFTDDFAADAARRDFTINAMSCEVDGTLHDPMGGRADLAAGLVRFVGPPERRIAEDYLRILRFFRFHARFGSGAPDPGALAACTRLARGIDGLSGERIRQELWLILLGPRPAATIALMRAAGVLGHILPGEVAPECLDRVAEADGLLRLAALIRPAPAARADAVAERLRLSNAEGARLRDLACREPLDPRADAAAQRRAIHALGAPLYRDLVLLGRAAGEVSDADADRLVAMAADWQIPLFPLTGTDLLALGVPSGPGLGRILDHLRKAWVASDFTLDRAALLADAARRHLTP